jgi:hypothetical protein
MPALRQYELRNDRIKPVFRASQFKQRRLHLQKPLPIGRADI